MTRTGTNGDHRTLLVSSNLYNIELQIVSSFRNDARTLIQLQEFDPIVTFYVGHSAEGGGENYVILNQHSSNVAH